MSDLTQHYGLQKLSKTQPFATNGQKYTVSDRDLIDRLLYAGAQGHTHSGLSPASMDPTTGPTLSLGPDPGNLPAGSRIWYKYTWVDSQGFETAASPESYLDTPISLMNPQQPSLLASPTGGTLQQGGYFYAVTAFTGVSTAETVAGINYVVVPPPGGTSSVTLSFPTAVSGSTGWNIYRRGPSESNYAFLTSVAIGATPPATWVDNGSYTENLNRQLPGSNVTSSTNSIVVTVPTVPTGYTWNVYRTLTSGVYDNTLLHNVVESTVEGGTIITPTYKDTGSGTFPGKPPDVSTLIGGAPKINLTTDVTGTLPPITVNSFPVVLTFSLPGPVIVQSGMTVWVCEFVTARIISVRASLGRGSHPAAQPVIVDIMKGSGTAPTYASVFAVNPKPQVPLGVQIGNTATPDAPVINQGDSLSMDVHQSGGGATPTDTDLTVNILLMCSGSGLSSV